MLTRLNFPPLRDEIESLVDFLGRPPSSAAFLESLIGPAAAEANPKL